MDGHVGSRIKNVNREGWNTLAELRKIALAQGCTEAQLKYAEERAGGDPIEVAAYLQRHAFMKGGTPRVRR
jgi:hypothetical protein